MYCSSCGTENTPAARFCANCGTALPTAPVAPAAHPIASAPPAPASPPATAPAAPTNGNISYGNAGITLIPMGLLLGTHIAVLRDSMRYQPLLALGLVYLIVGFAGALALHYPQLQAGRATAVGAGLILAGIYPEDFWWGTVGSSLVTAQAGYLLAGAGFGLLMPLTFWRELRGAGLPTIGKLALIVIGSALIANFFFHSAGMFTLHSFTGWLVLLFVLPVALKSPIVRRR